MFGERFLRTGKSRASSAKFFLVFIPFSSMADGGVHSAWIECSHITDPLSAEPSLEDEEDDGGLFSSM